MNSLNEDIYNKLLQKIPMSNLFTIYKDCTYIIQYHIYDIYLNSFILNSYCNLPDIMETINQHNIDVKKHFFITDNDMIRFSIELACLFDKISSYLNNNINFIKIESADSTLFIKNIQELIVKLTELSSRIKNHCNNFNYIMSIPANNYDTFSIVKYDAFSS